LRLFNSRTSSSTFNPETSISTQKSHPYAGNRNRETVNGDSKNAVLHVEIFWPVQGSEPKGGLKPVQGPGPKAGQRPVQGSEHKVGLMLRLTSRVLLSVRACIWWRSWARRSCLALKDCSSERPGRAARALESTTCLLPFVGVSAVNTRSSAWSSHT